MKSHWRNCAGLKRELPHHTRCRGIGFYLKFNIWQGTTPHSHIVTSSFLFSFLFVSGERTQKYYVFRGVRIERKIRYWSNRIVKRRKNKTLNNSDDNPRRNRVMYSHKRSVSSTMRAYYNDSLINNILITDSTLQVFLHTHTKQYY